MPKEGMTCRVDHCSERVHSGGLCEEHFEQERVRTRRNDAARDALNTMMIEGRLPDDAVLREELSRLRNWWDRACHVIRTQYKDNLMPFNEAEYACDWCIALATEIIDAELAMRNGKEVNNSLDATRAWVWDRFKNLEAGLQSNGFPR